MSQQSDSAGLGLPQVAACLLVGYFVFRWFFKSNDPSSTAQRRPPPVDPRRLQEQTDVVRGMFPQVSAAAVRAELVRNGGNIEITTERILTTGFLPEVSCLFSAEVNRERLMTVLASYPDYRSSCTTSPTAARSGSFISFVVSNDVIPIYRFDNPIQPSQPSSRS